jgi:hypothetical protein
VVLHFSDEDVHKNLDDVIATIRAVMDDRI